MKQKQIDELDLSKYKEDSKMGLILEVDLKYPTKLHDLHNDYPLAPEKIKVTKDMLSKYSEKIAEKYGISTGLVHKLIPTLSNKKRVSFALQKFAIIYGSRSESHQSSQST